jgi:hypothetical protein
MMAAHTAAVLSVLWRSAQGGSVSAMKYLDGKFNPTARLGKKEARRQAAFSGHENTEWAELLG